MKPRKEKLITTMNKDEWIDSVEIKEVRLLSLFLTAPTNSMQWLKIVRVIV